MSATLNFLRRNALLLIPAALWLGWLFTFDPISRNSSHKLRVALSVVSALLGLVWLGKRWYASTELGLPRRLWRLVAVMGVLLGLGNYFSFNQAELRGLGDHTDPAYYYLNSKYFSELGYFGLYEALMLADSEGPDRVASKLRKVRNLRDYEVESARDTLKRAPKVKANFSEQRWQQFAHDADWFLSRKSTDSLKSNFFVDHGYNATPPWTLVGRALSSAVPVEQVKWLGAVDIALCAGMFVAVAWAFGWDVCLLALLWWLCTMSGRWPVMGQAILRFDWVAGVVVGVCALNRGRAGLGGAAMVWASLSRVFPAVFLGPAALVFMARVARARTLDAESRRFFLGGAGFAALVLALSLASVGVDGFRSSAKNLAMHNDSPEAYSSQKVGLADALYFRGETTRDEMRDSPCGWMERTLSGVDCVDHGDAGMGVQKGNGIAGKGVLVHHVKPWLKGVGLLAIGWIGWLAWRRRARPEELVPLGALLVFIMTTPSYYYYTLRIVLVLGHLGRPELRRNQVGLLLLFAIEAVSNVLITLGWVRYGVTASLSWMMLGYFAVVVGMWVFERGREE